MDLEFFFLLENIATIILGLSILVIGFRLKDRLHTDDARQRLIADWKKYSIGIGLFGIGLFLYFISESARFLVPYYPSLNLEEMHEWGEVIHMFVIMFAMIISIWVAVEIGGKER